jgi:antitoxin ParD1/3/4
METMNIALPDELKDYVKKRIGAGGYSSVSEYVRELIRNDQRDHARKLLEGEVLKGLRSGESVPMTKADWAEIRAEVTKRYRKNRKRK